MAKLFERDIKIIGKHINNVFKEGELEKQTTVANFSTVQTEGNSQVQRHAKEVIRRKGYDREYRDIVLSNK